MWLISVHKEIEVTGISKEVKVDVKTTLVCIAKYNGKKDLLFTWKRKVTVQ